jgi:hypothetical protein
MNNSKTAFKEAKNCEMIEGSGNTEQMSLIINLSEFSRHIKEVQSSPIAGLTKEQNIYII